MIIFSNLIEKIVSRKEFHMNFAILLTNLKKFNRDNREISLYDYFYEICKTSIYIAEACVAPRRVYTLGA